MLLKIVKKFARIMVAGVLFYLPYKLIGFLQKYILCELALFCGWRAYSVDPLIVRNVKYKNMKMKVHIQTYYDYWRMSDYEKYAVEKVENDIAKTNGRSKEIVYYEVGANIGYSVLALGKVLESRGRVFAFEVEPTNFKTLSDNIRLNDFKNVIAIPLGIAEKSSISKFYYNQAKAYEKSSLLSSSGIGMHSLDFD